MRAVEFTRVGSPAEALRLITPAVPSPGPGEVLLEVEAAGVNFSDTIRRRGLPYPTIAEPPYILGGEAVGRIVGVGVGVGDEWLDRRVFAWPDHGCYAEYATVPLSDLAEVGEESPASVVLGLGIQGMTAWLALTDAAHVKPGDSIYIEGAAGGVGALAVQLAAHLGAKRVFGSASTVERRFRIEELGAIAIDNSTPGWWGGVIEQNDGAGVDVAVQIGAGRIFQETLLTLADGGTMIVVGASPATDTQRSHSTIEPGLLIGRSLTIKGFFLGRYLKMPGIAAQTMRDLAALVVAGTLEVNVFGEFSLSDAAQVHELLEGRRTAGKLILQPSRG